MLKKVLEIRHLNWVWRCKWRSFDVNEIVILLHNIKQTQQEFWIAIQKAFDLMTPQFELIFIYLLIDELVRSRFKLMKLNSLFRLLKIFMSENLWKSDSTFLNVWNHSTCSCCIFRDISHGQTKTKVEETRVGFQKFLKFWASQQTCNFTKIFFLILFWHFVPSVFRDLLSS